MSQKLDRVTAPEFGEINEVNMLRAEPHTLDNGIPLFSIRGGVQPVVRLDILFPAGKWYQTKALVAYATNSMLDDGTSKHDSSQIADAIDFYGAYIQKKSDLDFAEVTLYAQVKHLASILPLMHELLTDSIFPEHELAVFKQNNKEKLIQNLDRVEVLASHKMQQVLFGEQHPYGQVNTAKDYDQLTSADLMNFYKKQYRLADAKMIVSGQVDDEVIKTINSVFGKISLTKTIIDEVPQRIAHPASEHEHLVKKDKAVQAALRVGKIVPNRTHPDYQGLLILNTVLGGYFGSRLMSNIREDKGYTYGIHSSISSHLQGASMNIATEVGVSVGKDAMQEIFNEIKLLREELVPEEELQLVRNYLSGSFLRGIDGPFALADRFAAILKYNQGYDYYETYFKKLKSIRPEELQQLALKYYADGSFFQVTAGS